MKLGEAFVAAAVIGGALFAVDACASFDDASADDATVDAGPSDASAPDAETPFCEGRDEKLCEDFEQEVLGGPPRWTEVERSNAPIDSLAIVGADAGADNAFLRVLVPETTATTRIHSLRRDIDGTPGSIRFALTIRNLRLGAEDYVELANVYPPQPLPASDLPLPVNAGIAFDRGRMKAYVQAGDSDAYIATDIGQPVDRVRYEAELTGTTYTVTDDKKNVLASFTHDAGALPVPMRFGIGLAYTKRAVDGGAYEIDDVTLDY